MAIRPTSDQMYRGNTNCSHVRCSHCSNVFVLPILLLAIAGFLLVIFLFTCKVTVAAGTTGGLTANVVAVNRSVFFPCGETNVLTVFGINLDLDIEMCFFDAYIRELPTLRLRLCLQAPQGVPDLPRAHCRSVETSVNKTVSRMQ